jgi:hypothetical protein
VDRSLEEKINNAITEHLGFKIGELEFCDKALDALDAVQYGLEMRRQELVAEAEDFDDEEW